MNSNGNVAGEPNSEDRRIQLRKYRNRRYYDVTRSQHVTLEAIHSLVRDGYDIEVTDTETGENITAKVLTQILLDHDAPKLDLFPAELLHQVIRANEPLVRDFIEKYFSQAFSAFCESQAQFSQYLRQAMGLDSPIVPAAAWPRAMLGPLSQAFLAQGSPVVPPPSLPGGSGESSDDLRAVVEQLRQQVDDLHGKLARPSGGQTGGAAAD